MKKRYVVFGILIITLALAISAGTWISISRANRAQIQAGPGLVLAGHFIDDHNVTQYSPGLVVVGKYIDDHYSTKYSPYQMSGR